VNTYTKEEFEQMNAPEPTVEQKRTVATRIAKRIYDWQEKQGIYAFDADACEAGCGVMITPIYNAYHTPKGSEVEDVAEFRRTGDCAFNEGVCGNYKLTDMDLNGICTWRIERIERKPKGSA
jgi:hypothetical protein